MRLVILFDMLLNPSFKMTTGFANVARTNIMLFLLTDSPQKLKLKNVHDTLIILFNVSQRSPELQLIVPPMLCIALANIQC